MSVEQDILALRSRVHELEERLKFVYQQLRIEYVPDPQAANSEIIEFIRRGKKIDAIKLYRQIYNVGLGEAKKAVDGMEEKLL